VPFKEEAHGEVFEKFTILRDFFYSLIRNLASTRKSMKEIN